MGSVFTWVVIGILCVLWIGTTWITYKLLKRILNAATTTPNLTPRDYFYLFINLMFPFLFIAAEGIIKWARDSKELESFWVVGTISAAMGLLLGNVKPKDFVSIQGHRPGTNAWYMERDKFKDRDANIIRWCWVLLFVEFVVWIYASIAVLKEELPDFWLTLIGTILVNLVSFYMSYRKELV